MSTMVVDTSALLKMLIASLVAGVGISVAFSLAILGAIRAGEARRDTRGAATAAYAVLAMLGVAASAAAVVYGVVLVAQK